MSTITTNNQNQGASIEAERAAFEAWHRSKFGTKHSTGQPTRDMHNGIYDENYGPKDQQMMWEVWQAARRTPAATTGAAPSVKTWQERIPDVGTHKDVREAMQAEIADLRAQLAVKGQGYVVEVKPGEKCPCGQTREWCIANECKDAAPASAQPADLENEIQYLKNVAADAVPMLSHDWPKTSLLLKDAVEKVDAASKAGAQPDQRESAAAKLICSQCGVDRFKAPCPRMADECAMIADAHLLAASPAAQPAKDEQKGDA